ncbi:anti-sigma factor domain-containing protein [Deinococcus roseus]|uniref:Regulator of SigK n=1 Tax=Deinococcus roseus TaxID=392414 RepID=A0ABQ2D1M3_9DEIO|nr:anti-sigma factor [Deinococcus roseus]GGJ42055.1 anti-sigma E factor [Deinococcus roseus]
MKYTREQLADYVLGQLEPQEMQEIADHLQTSAEARREVEDLQEALFRMAEELPPIPVNPDSWQKIQSKLEPQIQQPEASSAPVSAPAARSLQLPSFLSWAAVVAVLLVGGWFGVGVYQENQQTRLIESWLQNNPKVEALKLQDQTQVASVAFHPDGQALVIMNQKAEQQKSYQVWGIKGGQPVSLGVVASRTFQVDTSGYEAIAVSLEPEGGSATPTQVLGAVPIS